MGEFLCELKDKNESARCVFYPESNEKHEQSDKVSFRFRKIILCADTCYVKILFCSDEFV